MANLGFGSSRLAQELVRGLKAARPQQFAAQQPFAMPQGVQQPLPTVNGIPGGGNPFPPFGPLPTGQSYDQGRQAMHGQFGDAMAYLRGLKQNLGKAPAMQQPQAQTQGPAAAVPEPAVESLKASSGFSQDIVERNIQDYMKRGMSREQAIATLRGAWGGQVPGGGGGAMGRGGPGFGNGGLGPDRGPGFGSGGTGAGIY